MQKWEKSTFVNRRKETTSEIGKVFSGWFTHYLDSSFWCRSRQTFFKAYHLACRHQCFSPIDYNFHEVACLYVLVLKISSYVVDYPEYRERFSRSMRIGPEWKHFNQLAQMYFDERQRMCMRYQLKYMYVQLDYSVLKRYQYILRRIC